MTEDDRLVRSLRDAIDPGLAPGAAERIAAGAWDRAAELRATPAPRFRLLRRTSWVAAAAASAAAVAVLAVRDSEAAFAVEGDPVKVQEGGAWVETSRVPEDALVEVPTGTRVLRFTRGGTLRPEPGSVFRLVRSEDASRSFRVEFQRGGGDVQGAAFEVRANTVAVQRDPAAPGVAFTFTVDTGGAGPRVAVGSGRAVVRSLVSADRLVVNASERAALLHVNAVSQAVSSRLMKVSEWSGATQARMNAGRWSVVDAGFNAQGDVVLVGQDATKAFTAVEVPSVEAPTVLADLRSGMRSAWLSAWVADAGSRANVPVARRVPSAPQRTGGKLDDGRLATLTYTDRDGRTTLVQIDARGGVNVGRLDPSWTWTAFPDVAAFRAAMPETAALFGDELR